MCDTFVTEKVTHKVVWKYNIWIRFLENWYSDRWNDGVTPRNACLNTAICVDFCSKNHGIKLAEVGRSLPKRVKPWKLSQRWDMQMICRRSIKYLWSECQCWLTKSRMYESKRHCGRNAVSRIRECMRMSKNSYYESPCNVTGIGYAQAQRDT